MISACTRKRSEITGKHALLSGNRNLSIDANKTRVIHNRCNNPDCLGQHGYAVAQKVKGKPSHHNPDVLTLNTVRAVQDCGC